MFKQMFFPYDPRGNELEGKKKKFVVDIWENTKMQRNYQ